MYGRLSRFWLIDLGRTLGRYPDCRHPFQRISGPYRVILKQYPRYRPRLHLNSVA